MRGQDEINSLRSSRLRFLQAKRGKRARALGKKEQKSRSGGGGGGAPPPRSYFFAPRALTTLGLKETETTATQATK